MRKTKLFVLTCFFVLTAVLALYMMPTVAQDSGETPCSEKNGIYDPVTMSCVLKAGLTIDMDYPWHFTEFRTLKASIDVLYNGLAHDFAANYADVIALSGPGGTLAPWSLYLSYDMYNVEAMQYDHIDLPLSYVFTVSEYTGGAHPNSRIITMNHDLRTGINLTLDDLFIPGVDYLPTLSQLAQQSLKAQHGNDIDETWLAQGTEPDPVNFSRFVITQTELLIFFDPYQVAPYAMGPQMVNIPLSQISSLLNSRFVN